MKVTMTDHARDMLENRLGDGQFLRVEITEGGCAGLTYGARVDNAMQEDDAVLLEAGKVRVVAGSRSKPYLDGLVIDYSDDLLAGGLKFTNEKARTTCGCGASFNLTGFPVKDDGSCAR